MINKILVVLITFFAFTAGFAQENRTQGGMRQGHWTIKDKRDFVCAEGYYKDNARSGPWQFFVSPISRYTHVPDVKGSYTDAGKKTGVWTFVSTTTKIVVEAEFANDLMEGKCTYFAANGDLLATGLMSAGIRHGKWIFYHHDKKMTEGYYQNGVKIGDWVYDYFPEKNLHIKGAFNYDKGVQNGKLEFYRVENHPQFGTDELLSGVGTYLDGKKIGRWIEYHQGLKGEFVETGNYNKSGRKQGFWKSTMERKNYQAAIYEDGVLNGLFKQYHDNGKLKYETNFEKGLAIGDFVRYYEDGNMEEKGKMVFSPDPKDVTVDTLYFSLELPFETHFQLIELPNFQDLDHHYAEWIEDPAYSIEPAELDRRFNTYKEYGLEPQKRVVGTKVVGRKAVREGYYQTYYTNGKLKLEGNYYPKVTDVFNPETNTIIRDYARDGEWKQYDDNGYLMRVFTYDRGKLIKTLDDKGKELGINENSASNKNAAEDDNK